MITFTAHTGDQVWMQALKQLRSAGNAQNSRIEETRELLHVGMSIEDPRQRVVFARPINPAFAIAEVIWIMAGSNDLAFVKQWNGRMQEYSDDQEQLHGAYGYRLGINPIKKERLKKKLYHDNNALSTRINQIESAYKALKQTPFSRQVVLQIWNSYLDLPDPTPRSKDIPCNTLSHLMIREGKLEWLQVMRSNDLMWGTPYNFIQFTMMQEIFAGWLHVDLGTYNHISDSLHVYEKHFHDIAVLKEKRQPVQNTADLRIDSYEAWQNLWEFLVENVLAVADAKDAKTVLRLKQSADRKLTEGYQQLLSVLCAEKARKLKAVAVSLDLAQMAGAYWETSWLQWAATINPHIYA